MMALIVVFSFLVVALGLSLFVLGRLGRVSAAACYSLDAALPAEPQADIFVSDITANLFSSQDAAFLAGEITCDSVRRFREMRTSIALGWVRRERERVSCLFRDHRRNVRSTADLSPVDEVKVLRDFLSFQVMSGLLYFLIAVRGPSRAARLVRWSCVAAEKLQAIVDRAIPASSPTVEVIRPE